MASVTEPRSPETREAIDGPGVIWPGRLADDDIARQQLYFLFLLEDTHLAHTMVVRDGEPVPLDIDRHCA
jgi:hypothetical protein